MSEPGSRNEHRQTLKTVLIIAAGLLFAWASLGILRSLRWLFEAGAVAVFMSLAAEPAVRWMERHGIKRGAGAGIMVATVIATVIGIGWVLVPAVGNAVTYIVDNADQVSAQLGDFAENFGADPDAVSRGITATIGDLKGVVGRQESAKLLAAAGLAALQAASTLFLFYYLLASGPNLRRSMLRLIGDENRRRAAARTWDMAIEKTGGFLYGNLVLAVICGVVTSATAALLGVVAPVGLGAWAVVASLIPVLGGWLASSLPVMVALTADLSGGGGLRNVITMAVVLAAFQAADNYALRPRVLSATVEIPPALAFLVVVGGASAGGLIGAVLAIPVAAIIYSFATEWMRNRPELEAELDTPTNPQPPRRRRRRR